MVKILVIDDKKDNLVSAKALLKNLEPEFEVFTAQSGIEGIKLAKSKLPDTILLDIQMPKMDGYEVCRRLRADKNTNRVPIIFLTAIKTRSKDKIKGLELGGDAYLTKPIDSGELLAHLHAMLRIKRVEDELEKEKDLLEVKVTERTKELQELNAKYIDSYDHAPDMFVSVDGKTSKILRCNQTLAETLGYKKDELIGQTIFFVYHPDCIEAAKKYFQQFVDTGEVHGAELQLIRKDGRKIDVSLNVSAVRDKEGNVLYSRSIWRDITMRKRAEEGLRKSEQRYRGIFNESITAIYLFDAQKNFIDSNQAGLNLLGYSRAELLKMSIPDMDADPQVVLPAHEQLLAGDRIINFEHQLKRKDGRIITVLNNSRPITNDNGDVIGMQSTLIDITKRRQAEDMLKRSKDKYKSLFANMNNAFAYHKMIFDDKNQPVDYVFLEVNNAFEKNTGLKQKDIIGKKVTEVIPGIEKTKPDLISIYGKVAKTGKSTTFELYFEPFEWWFAVSAYCPEKGYFVVVFDNITEQKQVQEKLKAAQEFSRNIIDSSLNMIITVDQHRHITEFNPAAEHTFGYTREEILGKHINILYAKLEQGRQVHRKTMESGQHVQEVLNKRKNGKVFPAVLASSTLVNSQGKLIGVMGISRDISEQNTALDRLKESEEQFRSMTNTATDAIIGMDEKGTIQIWNPAAAQLFGYTEKEALEKNLHALIVPTHYRKQARSALKEFFKTGKGRVLGKTIELTGLKKNGKEFPIELSISSNKRQGKWQATGIIRDITERKEAEDIIKQSETKFRTLFEESNDTIYITRLDGEIIDMSPAGEELFRYTREELLKMKVHQLYVCPEERKVFQQMMREKGLVRNYELRLKRKDGVLRNCLVSASLWKDNTGKFIGYQGIIHDVTEEVLVQNELKEALLKAQEADRVKSLFLANMSHEIRTPLNTVLGFTELVEHIVKDQIPAEEQGFFKIIRTSGERLSHTIHEILNISQIEAGTFQIHLKEHNLVEILEIATTPFKSQAAEKGLEFTGRSTIAEAPVYADEYCVIQAISNVVENAIKYTPKGRVEVILNGARNTFNVRVTDTGVGIAKKNLKDIFKEFKQESEGYTKKYQGVGLGLALVKRYLEICRADIEVKSEKGAGSTFILKFPKWRGKKHKVG